MSELNSYFIDFLRGIRPTARQLRDFQKGHKLLRERLMQDEALKDCIVTTFLQGSYRRRTAVRPLGDARSDVDVVVVTNLDRESVTAEQAIQKFVDFMERHYKGKYELQGRSIGISLSYVDLDLVPTSAPSEAQKKLLLEMKDEQVNENLNEEIVEEAWDITFLSGNAANTPSWKQEVLYIPDRNAKEWQRTHPLEQLDWTRKKNGLTNGHYINIVKAIKWWRRINYDTPKYPKGYLLERIIAECCPDAVTTMAEGVTHTLEAIVRDYSAYAAVKATPHLSNQGVPEQNVLARLSGEDFAAFHKQASEAATTARRALDSESTQESAELWRTLFGDKFPKAPTKGSGTDNGSKGGFNVPSSVSQVESGRFA